MYALSVLSPAATTAAGPRPFEADVLYFLADIIGAIPTVIMLAIMIAAFVVLGLAALTRNAPLRPSERSSWDDRDQWWQEGED